MNIGFLILFMAVFMVLRNHVYEKLTGDKKDLIRQFLEKNDDISTDPFFIAGLLEGEIDEKTSDQLIELSTVNDIQKIKILLNI